MLIYTLAFIVLWSTPACSGPKGYTARASSSKAYSKEEIDDTHVLAKEISYLYITNNYKDVDLVVDGEEVPAHRILLASRSKYFEALLYREDKKTYKDDVSIKDVPVALFKILLEHIYTGLVDLSDLEDTVVFKLGRISNYFGFLKLKHSLDEHSNKQIDHTHLLVSDISNLYLSKSFSDVILVVEAEEFHVHRYLLASRSKYFSVLLYGSHNETSKSRVNINEVPVTMFKIILKYIYTGRIHLIGFKDTMVFELLRFSVYFGVSSLKHSLHEYLQRDIYLDNLYSCLDMARHYQNKELEDFLIDNNAWGILRSEDFLSLSSETLQNILNRDTFLANEYDIFDAVCRWFKKNEKNLKYDTKINIFSAVRYSLMDAEDSSLVSISPLIRSDLRLRNITYRLSKSPDHRYRGQLKPNVNLVAEPQVFGVVSVMDGDTTITLRHPSFINYIEITLTDEGAIKEPRYYSYYIEVSITDKKYSWTRVIDHSNDNCRSIQRLWIDPRVVKYIRIVKTRSNANVTFRICNVSYNTTQMQNNY